MYEILDKIMIFICCLTLYIIHMEISYAIIPVILVIVLSSLFVYYDKDTFRIWGNLLFALLCTFMPSYAIFLPLLLYDILLTRYQIAVVILPLLFLTNTQEYSLPVFSFTMIFSIAGLLLKIKTNKISQLSMDYNELRDNSSSVSQLLEEKNRSILKNQDYEINLATLNERNRISKEIHDNIGHLLSRALLQVGALLTITKEEPVKDGLADLKESLSSGMDDIRNSIHKMYDDSIDLFTQIDQLVNAFTFCHIDFEFDINNSPPLVLKHGMIAIIKEGLANIMRHSNANQASILLREHPAMYQLILQDNGSLEEEKKNLLQLLLDKQDYGENMGLRNIHDRVKGYGGNINISLDKGFKIFISIPKNINEINPN